ncbi:MAG: YggT family protein [Treponema sp.]|nr:YggT family protein [Treponema sp.]
MRAIFSFLAFAAGIYSILIFVRIIISWFAGNVFGKPAEILKKITDPYLNWWRKNLKLQFGSLDFSAVAAIVFLSLLQNILFTLSVSQMITIGLILAQILLSLWTIITFIIGFIMVIIILRLFAYLTNRNIYSNFWRVIDSIYQPLMYRMNRIIFGNKIAGFMKGMIISLLLLALLMFGGRIIINLIAGFLARLPV